MKRKFYAYLAFLAIVFFYLSGNAQHIGLPGVQTAVFKNVNKGIPYGYYEYLPQNFDANPNSKQKYPVVIFFAGVGELGNGTTDLPKMLNPTAPPKLIQNGKHFPAIVISAQHSGWFNEAQSKELYDYITARYPVDSNRVYITGLSAGGAATWKFARAYPELPAAIVPIAGATQYKSAQTQMQNMSIWAFHNVGDGYPGGGVPSVWTMYNCDWIANISSSVRQVYPGGWGWGKTAGFDVTMHFMDSTYWDPDTGIVEPKQNMAITMYNAFGHSGWGKVYSNQYMWDWLFDQSRGGSTTPPPPPPPKPKDSVVVDAGIDVQLDLPLNEFTLNGSAYSLIGTAISSYHWTQESGPTVTMSGILTPELTIKDLKSGTYVFVLTATTLSLNGAYNHDTVVVEVNAPPVANAGLDQFVFAPQDSTYLDGSLSYDPENNALNYDWKLIDSKLYGDTDTTIVTTPSAKADFKVFINFTPSWIKASAPWNNINGSINAGTKLLNMVDDSGSTTGIDLELVVGWNGSKKGGKSTGNNTGVYPDDVIEGVYWFQNRTPQIKLSGLDTSYVYKFKFFGSRTGMGLNKTTIYHIGNKKDSLNAAENTSDLAVIQNIEANNNGEILIDISTGAGAPYGYLNAIEIEAAPKNNNSVPSTVITVTPPANVDSNEYFVNFTPNTLKAGKPWNNTSGNKNAGYILNGLKDKNGNQSNISMKMMTSWNGSKLGGKLTGNNSGYFDDDVLNGFYWFNNSGQQIEISGLNPAIKYEFTFMGSRTGWGTNKMTIYEINGVKDSLNAAENTNNAIILKDITPNANGKVVVTITRGSGVSYSYLNAMVIKEKIGKQGLSIVNPNKAITLVKGLRPGRYTFELTVNDNRQLIDKDQVMVEVGNGSVARLKTSTEEASIVNNENDVLNPYPNPAIDYLNIDGTNLENATIELLDLRGQRLLVDIVQGANHATIDVGSLPSGYYIVRVTKGNSSKAARVVVAPR